MLVAQTTWPVRECTACDDWFCGCAAFCVHNTLLCGFIELRLVTLPDSSGILSSSSEWLGWAPQLRVDLAFRHSRYIFICLNRPCDRLALGPRRSKQNPAQIPYVDFGLLWLWLTMIFPQTGTDASARDLLFKNISPSSSFVQLTGNLSEKNAPLKCPTSVLAFFPRLAYRSRRGRPLTSEVPLSTLVG